MSWTDNPTNNNSYCACDFAEFRCSIIAAIPSCSGYVINHHFKTSNDRRIIQPHSSLLSHPKTKAAVARIFVRGLDFPYPSLPFPTSSLALHLPFPLLTSFPLSPTSLTLSLLPSSLPQIHLGVWSSAVRSTSWVLAKFHADLF